MGTTSIRIAAKPEEVYRQLTQPMDDIEPGPLKRGDLFAQPGKSEVFSVTVVEPPNRFGYSVVTGDVTTSALYTVAPDGDGSLVTVEMDQQSSGNPLMVMLYGSVMEGRHERSMLDDLKARIEESTAPSPASQPAAAPQAPTPAGPADAAAAARVVDPPEGALAADRRPCPRCGESIAAAAKVCRFCDLDLSTAVPA